MEVFLRSGQPANVGTGMASIQASSVPIGRGPHIVTACVDAADIAAAPLFEARWLENDAVAALHPSRM